MDEHTTNKLIGDDHAFAFVGYSIGMIGLGLVIGFILSHNYWWTPISLSQGQKSARMVVLEAAAGRTQSALSDMRFQYFRSGHQPPPESEKFLIEDYLSLQKSILEEITKIQEEPGGSDHRRSSPLNEWEYATTEYSTTPEPILYPGHPVHKICKDIKGCWIELQMRKVGE